MEKLNILYYAVRWNCLRITGAKPYFIIKFAYDVKCDEFYFRLWTHIQWFKRIVWGAFVTKTYVIMRTRCRFWNFELWKYDFKLSTNIIIYFGIIIEMSFWRLNDDCGKNVSICIYLMLRVVIAYISVVCDSNREIAIRLSLYYSLWMYVRQKIWSGFEMNATPSYTVTRWVSTKG